MEVEGTVVGALDADQVAPVEAAGMDIRDPAQVALEVSRAGSRLEGDDVAALDNITSTALDAGRGGAGSTEEGRGGRGEVLEVDHLGMLVKAEQSVGRGSRRWIVEERLKMPMREERNSTKGRAKWPLYTSHPAQSRASSSTS